MSETSFIKLIFFRHPEKYCAGADLSDKLSFTIFTGSILSKFKLTGIFE
jgi:hypothetical protein